MARARNIKPGFFTNDLLAEIVPLGRILFAGLWTLADRAGRLEDRPKKIKAEVLPFDNCNVDKLLGDLTTYGFIKRYQTDGGSFIQIIKWDKHQNPHVKEAASTIPAPGEHSANPVQSTVRAPEIPERAGLIPDSLNLIPDSLNQGSANTAQPELRAPEPVEPTFVPSHATRLSMAMNAAGIRMQPADPRLIALAEQGVAPETVTAACQEAKASKPDEVIGAGYVMKILERWAKNASALQVAGAMQPRPMNSHAQAEKFDPVAYVNRNRVKP